MLDIRDYDIAVADRIKAFFSNTYWINRPSIPLQEIRDRKVLNGCDINFPLVVVRRTNCPMLSTTYNSWSRARVGNSYYTATPESEPNRRLLQNYDRDLVEKVTSNGHNDILDVVNSTFELTYYVDIISLERDNFDTLNVELQENLFKVPYVKLPNVKTNGEIDRIIPGQACHFLVEEVEDVSDLENFDSGNALFRSTITVKMNAYIYRKFRTISIEEFNLNYDIKDIIYDVDHQQRVRSHIPDDKDSGDYFNG